MNLFEKRETLVSNITYMAIMASINVVFALLSFFIPGAIFFLFFLLSLSSSLVAMFCIKKYYIVYFIVTLAITLPINFSDALFYVFPALVSGFVFGYCYEKKISPITLIILLTIVQMGFSYISIPMIEWLVDRNIVIDMAKIFKLEDNLYLNYIKHIFIFLISLIQQAISYAIIYSQVSRIVAPQEDLNVDQYLRYGFSVLCLLLSLLFMVIFPEYMLVFTCFTIVIAIYELALLFLKQNKLIYIELGVAFLINFFVGVAFYSLGKFPYSMLLVNIYLFSVLIIGFINNCLLNIDNKNTIK